MECDPNVEEKDPDVDPSLCFPSDPHSPDAPPESKDSGNDNAHETNNDSDESLNSSLTKLLENHGVPSSIPISNISDSSTLNLDRTLANFVEMSDPAPPRHEAKVEEVARSNLQGASSSTRGCTIKRERVNSNDSGSIDILAGLSGASSDRESIARSGSTSNQTGDSGGQSSSDATSIDSLTINQQLCDSISSTSDSWVDESDVLAAMQNLSLSSSRVVVSSKVFAGVMLKARPPSYDVSKLVAAQERSFKVAQQDLDRRMTSLRASESKKIQEPRKKMEQLVLDYEEKLRVLNVRLQAGEALQSDSVGTTAQLENALEEAHSENRALKEKVKNLQKILKDVFETGTAVQEDSKAKQQSSCDDSKQSSSHGSHVSKHSSTSTDVAQRRKRDLSPPKPKMEEFEWKKPKPRNVTNEAWTQWAHIGNVESAEYASGPVKEFLVTRTKDELTRIHAQVLRASEDFKNIYPKLDPSRQHPEDAILSRNADLHLPFARLQSELMIPTIAQGRKSSLNFYYGKILGSINDIFRLREQFQIVPYDAAKIRAFIDFLGANHQEVRNFNHAEESIRDIQTNSDRLRQAFYEQYIKAHEFPKPEWLCTIMHENIQNRANLNRSERDLLYDQAKVVYCDYHYFLFLHHRIEFYSKARTHFAANRRPRHSNNRAFRNNNTYGGGPQARN
jgi:hypothetical protein